MPLTSQQIADRAGKLTASRVACLMTGDKEKIMQLYNEMLGYDEPENLDDVWYIRLGDVTEKLQLDWYERKNGRSVTNRGYVMVHPGVVWAAATLDGWDGELRCPIEAKHVGGREPLPTIIDRYQPQMQWQMFVTGAKQCALSVIMGANEPVVEYIDRADDYIEEMVKRAKHFMWCVETKTPPVALDPVPPPAPDPTKIIDMTGNNEWGNAAWSWIANQVSAGLCKDAEKILKSLVPEDAKKCFGHGVQITRDRAGRLSLRELTE